MKRFLTSVIFLVICIGIALATVYRRRTLDEKTKEADLIVLGTATLFGEKEYDSTNVNDQYWQDIRLDVKAVLWPPAATNTSSIVFHSYVYETWPNSWWAYTNTPGVFFLMKGTYKNVGGWDRLPLFDDWMEAPTKAIAVLLSINRQKGQANTNGSLGIPALHWPKDTRYDGIPRLREAYLVAFRDGYFAALAGDNHILMFEPKTEEDKARVLGFADGQVAGDDARRDWLKKAGM